MHGALCTNYKFCFIYMYIVQILSCNFNALTTLLNRNIPKRRAQMLAHKTHSIKRVALDIFSSIGHNEQKMFKHPTYPAKYNTTQNNMMTHNKCMYCLCLICDNILQNFPMGCTSLKQHNFQGIDIHTMSSINQVTSSALILLLLEIAGFNPLVDKVTIISCLIANHILTAFKISRVAVVRSNYKCILLSW